MSLQITGWPGLNDRKNYVATDEESPEVLISVIRAIFARIKKKKKGKKIARKREKEKLPNAFNKMSVIYIYKRGQKTSYSCRIIERHVIKHGAPRSISTPSSQRSSMIEKTQSRSHPIKQRNVESLAPSFRSRRIDAKLSETKNANGEGWV